MALIHISKDPFNKTPVFCIYASLARYITLGRVGLYCKYVGLIETGIVSLEFPSPFLNRRNLYEKRNLAYA